MKIQNTGHRKAENTKAVPSAAQKAPRARGIRGGVFLGLRFVDVRGLSEREVFVLCRPGRLPTGLRSCAELQFLIGGVCEVTNCLMLVYCAETQSPAVRRWCAVMPCGDKISDDPVLVLCVWGDAVTGFRPQLSDAFACVGTVVGYCAESNTSCLVLVLRAGMQLLAAQCYFGVEMQSLALRYFVLRRSNFDNPLC